MRKGRNIKVRAGDISEIDKNFWLRGGHQKPEGEECAPPQHGALAWPGKVSKGGRNGLLESWLEDDWQEVDGGLITKSYIDLPACRAVKHVRLAYFYPLSYRIQNTRGAHV